MLNNLHFFPKEGENSRRICSKTDSVLIKHMSISEECNKQVFSVDGGNVGRARMEGWDIRPVAGRPVWKWSQLLR